MQRSKPWKTVWVVTAGSLLCLILAGLGIYYPPLFSLPGLAAYLPAPAPPEGPTAHYPYLELLKLLTAAVLGIIVVAVHRKTRRDKPQSSSLEHAQVLLCVSGAIIMVIIGNSLARAFGIAGGASIVRFRTPVEDPKDAIVLFLLLSIGMACGLAAFGFAIGAAAFLCALLFVLDRMAERRPREMTLELVAAGSVFPIDHVQRVFAKHYVGFEQREVHHGDRAVVRYQVALEPETSLETLSRALIGEADTLQSVSWVRPKKRA